MIALQLVREALADEVAPAPVRGDAAYGNNAEFRAGLRPLGAEFFLQAYAAEPSHDDRPHFPSASDQSVLPDA